MTDELTVRSAGGTSVDLGELMREAGRLGSATARCHDWEQRLSRVGRELWESSHHGSVQGRVGDDPSWSIDRAVAALRDASAEAAELRHALDTAATGYGDAELMIRSMWELGSRVGGHAFGENPAFGTAMGATAAVSPLLALLLGIGGATAGAWDPDAAWRRILADPALVRSVRAAGGLVDEAVMAALQLPLPVQALVGPMLRTPENAALLLSAAAGLGVLGIRAPVERPVQIVQSVPGGGAGTSTRTRAAGAAAGIPEGAPATTAGASVPPPAGVGELARRIPHPVDGEPQIAVERYVVGGEQRFIVYISGTVELTGFGGSQPLDMLNNLAAVGDDSWFAPATPESSGAAERAVRLALAEAGMRPGDRVLPVGFSAGGIAAADLARADDLAVAGALTLGSPSDAARTGDVPVLSIEHREDPVPATGGVETGSAGFVSIRRTLLDDAADDDLLAAHSLERYRETAARVDGSEDQRVLDFEAAVRDFTRGATGERTEWIATRVPRSG
ncbi:hypothetical protein [Agromyces sp. LHK192]|uniref:hypothetical protein n=1 Tax=Agromyces sp. LHK192 TaxID=2498704 RepID=UPI000FDC0430|nr:hypothetical protein [Agromyces sp. LHK192]